jgi:hypothetical protein
VPNSARRNVPTKCWWHLPGKPKLVLPVPEALLGPRKFLSVNSRRNSGPRKVPTTLWCQVTEDYLQLIQPPEASLRAAKGLSSHSWGTKRKSKVFWADCKPITTESTSHRNSTALSRDWNQACRVKSTDLRQKIPNKPDYSRKSIKMFLEKWPSITIIKLFRRLDVA